jgi:hypothetical protein
MLSAQGYVISLILSLYCRSIFVKTFIFNCPFVIRLRSYCTILHNETKNEVIHMVSDIPIRSLTFLRCAILVGSSRIPALLPPAVPCASRAIPPTPAISRAPGAAGAIRHWALALVYSSNAASCFTIRRVGRLRSICKLFVSR